MARGQDRLANIQALRGIAALMVVVLHAVSRGQSMGYELGWLGRLAPWGGAGVDLFFVISGFIMVYIHDARPKGAGEFLANRVTRIVPLYWTILAAYCVAASIGLLALWAPGGGQPWTSFLFVSRALSDEDPILFVGWTLEYEAFFYLCFASAIALCGRWERVRLLPVVAGMVGVPVLAGWIDAIALEFLFGIGIAMLWRRDPGGHRQAVALLLLVAGWTGLFASLGRDVEEVRALVYGVPAAAIVWGALWIRAEAGRLLVWLGEISYSLYLTHVFVIAFVFAWAKDAVSQSFIATIVMACVFVAVAVHRWVERPLARLLSNGVAAYSQRRVLAR